MSDEHRDTDDSSEKTPSRMSRSPQKSSKRPKTVPVKVTLLDGSAYETGVEVQQLLACAKTNLCCSVETWCQTSRGLSYSHTVLQQCCMLLSSQPHPCRLLKQLYYLRFFQQSRALFFFLDIYVNIYIFAMMHSFKS